MSAVDLAASVRTGQRTARSVVEEHLEAIDAAEDRIHAFNLVMADEALEAADALARLVVPEYAGAGRVDSRSERPSRPHEIRIREHVRNTRLRITRRRHSEREVRQVPPRLGLSLIHI